MIKIAALNSNYNNSFQSKTQRKEVVFRQKNILDEDVVNSKDDVKKLRRKYNALVLILSTLCLGLSGLYVLSGKKVGLRDVFSESSNFKSLKNNSQIPTINSCKSIDKNLKAYLEQQINYIKADRSLIDEAGKPMISNRLLLSGAPGNGKSFFAKIFAKSIDAKYMEVRQSDFNSKWAGEGTANFKKIFESILKEAEKNKGEKYVVCFNEIDTIVQPVEELSASQGSHGATLLQHRSVFLNYMDDLSAKAPNVIIVGTTNISPKNHKLDAASLSRFKKIIEVPFPDRQCLYEALKKNLEDIKHGDSFINKHDNELKKLAEDMEKRKFSFRNLETVVDDSKNLFLADALKNKEQDFKFEYLEKAKNNLSISDGEFKQ